MPCPLPPCYVRSDADIAEAYAATMLVISCVPSSFIGATLSACGPVIAQELVRLFSAYPSHPAILSDACLALHNLGVSDRPLYACMLQEGLLAGLLGAMDAHPSAQRLLEGACGVMAQFACTPEGKAAVLDAGGVRRIQAAKAAHTLHRPLLARADRALAALGEGPAGGVPEFVKVKEAAAEGRADPAAVAHITFLAARARGDTSVAVAYCDAVFAVSCLEGGEDACGEHVVRELLLVLGAHPREGDLQFAGITTLHNLCVRFPPFQRMVVECGGVPVILGAMDNHPGLWQLQHGCCDVLVALCGEGREAEALVAAGVPQRL